MRTSSATVVGLVLIVSTGVGVAGAEPDAPTTTEEFLAGMVTEEVEAGVFRVLNDGIRDLGHAYDGGVDDAVMVAGTGDVWRITPPRRLFQVGQEEVWDYDPGLVDIGQAKTEAGPDGRLWTPALGGLRVFDGSGWRRPSENYDIGGEFESVAVQDDGTVWLLGEDVLIWWQTDDEPDGTALTEAFDGWVSLLEVAVTSDGVAWLMGTEEGDGDSGVFLRFDGDDWQVIAAPDGVTPVPTLGSTFDVGPDGRVWTIGDPNWPHRSLARLDDEGWTVFTAADGVKPWGGHSTGWWNIDRVVIAPDGAVWVDAATTTRACDGLGRFEAGSWTAYLPGRCILDLDIAPDGAVWVVATEEGTNASDAWVHTYVITPKAVAQD